MEIDKKTPILMKLSKAMVLMALLEKSNMTTSEIARETYMTNARASAIIKELKDEGMLRVEKGEGFDMRKNKINLTIEGKAQAFLIQMSTKIVPGKDELSIAIINAIKKIRGE